MDASGHDWVLVLAAGEGVRLRVLPVAECGWSDLGTPERIIQTLSPLPPAFDTRDACADQEAPVSLASVLRLATPPRWPVVSNAA